MKILHITDIHGEVKYIDLISESISSARLIALSGDIVKKGGRDAGDIFARIERYNRNIVAVHGNWDGHDVQDFIVRKGYGLHRDGRTIEGIGFFGAGGSGPTPFNSPSEYSDEEFLEFLHEGYEKVKGSARKVLIAHAPPKNTLDRTFIGLRGGSRGIREFIEKNRIDLCLTGHIHESPGKELLNSCIIANPGPFKKGRYLEADIDEQKGIALDDVRLMKARKG